MNILNIAENDLEFILEDIDNGFAVLITFSTDDDTPVEIPVNCMVSDIGFFIDPQTGVGVAGRSVKVTARISTIRALYADDPDENWTCEYVDKQGNTWPMAIAEGGVMIDRTLGLYNITLEVLNIDES